MELLLLVLGIFGSGIAAKAGEDTFDAGRKLLTEKLKGSDTGRALAAGEEIDPEQAVIDVEVIAADDEVKELLAEIQKLLAQNEDLQQQVNELIKKQPSITKTIQGINVESGGVVHNPTFHF
ncbi:hypothetical protein Lepto7376_2624 [[Leptolyngbya] sp. PCC 7376]|uniref:hypothetical protein n=1 Tax=[Leptolyngbya] sp. PCC 7376 TaxID=111781 RepID=UPI00029F2054|nr:hypothetical protein [[Leptolyngbya] sp. PCC 7376]AFY38895.1 hypothetical protein Lepto7376_2624 [[Leptolyngbya] sp. PCC 7376]